MKRIPKILITLIVSCLLTYTHAQTYQVSVSNEPFVFLENPQSAVEGAWNVPVFQLPLGFNFEFFDISSNQLFSIGNSVGAEFQLNQDEDHLYELIPFYASLIDRGYQQNSALSPINYKTEGLAGQRVFTLEYVEAGFFYGLKSEEGIYLDYISFQLKLYESSGDIEIHIGPYSIQEDLEIVFEGEPGPLIGLLADAENTPGGSIGEIILLAGNALNPTIVTDNIVFFTWPIPVNTVYRFSRMGTSIGEHLNSTKQPILFPNPTSGDLYLNENNTNDIIFPIMVFDVLGKQADQWNSEAEISAADLTTGSYYVIIHTENKVITEKLLVLPD